MHHFLKDGFKSAAFILSPDEQYSIGHVWHNNTQ